MLSSNQVPGTRKGSTGRGFASMDPERQSEIAGTALKVRSSRSSGRGPAPAPRADWMRGQSDHDAWFEGSSSRRSR